MILLHKYVCVLHPSAYLIKLKQAGRVRNCVCVGAGCIEEVTGLKTLRGECRIGLYPQHQRRASSRHYNL